jgi:chromosome segregation ATPase
LKSKVLKTAFLPLNIYQKNDMSGDSIMDIKYPVSSLLTQVQQLESRLQLLEKENGMLRYRLYHAEKEITRLRERLSRYESPKKDSHNSHTTLQTGFINR